MVKTVVEGERLGLKNVYLYCLVVGHDSDGRPSRRVHAGRFMHGLESVGSSVKLSLASGAASRGSVNDHQDNACHSTIPLFP